MCIRAVCFHDSLDHFAAQFRCLFEPRTEERRGMFKSKAVQLETPETDALAPTARGDDELEVVSAMGDVSQCSVDGSVQPRVRAEEVLRHADPEAEEGRRSEGKVDEGVDPERGPAVDHREEREVRVRVVVRQRHRASCW